MSRATRRRFLRTLGLGAGASLLLPISKRLVSRALGMDEGPRQRLFVMSPYMMEPHNYLPEGVEAGGQDPVELTPATWPAVFAPLDAHMPQALFVDAARNDVGTHQHRAGTSALACAPPAEGKPERMGPAGGPTLDQFVARTLSADSPFASMNWGLSNDHFDAGRATASGIFATAPRANIPHFTDAGAMFEHFFPDATPGGGGPATASFRPLRDRLLADLAQLRSRLAPEERLALDTYEEVIVDFDRRQEARGAVSCDAPSDPSTAMDLQDHLESMMDQSLLGLRCGLTPVVAATVGMTGNHNKHQAFYRVMRERASDPERAGFYGHGGANPENFPHSMETRRNQHIKHFEEIARLLDALAATPEPDGSTALDHTVVVYTTGNSVSRGGHHAPDSDESLWPVLVIAGARTGLRTGGRYVSQSRHGVRGERWALANVFRTICAGMGLDPAGFGDPAVETSLLETMLA